MKIQMITKIEFELDQVPTEGNYDRLMTEALSRGNFDCLNIAVLSDRYVIPEDL